MKNSTNKKQNSDFLTSLLGYFREQKGKGDKFVLNPLAREMRNNFALLRDDPLYLRYKDLRTGAAPLSNLQKRLVVFWGNAVEFLRDYQGGTVKLWPVTEKDLSFYEQPNENAKLTEGQKNALHVFRCIRQIQKYVYTNEPIYQEDGPINYYPIGFKENDEDNSEFEQVLTALKQIPDGTDLKPFLVTIERQILHDASELALEVMHLTLAVVKCDFYDFIWPDAQRGAKQELQFKQLREKKNANPIREQRYKALKECCFEYGIVRPKEIVEQLKGTCHWKLFKRLSMSKSTLNPYKQRYDRESKHKPK